MVFVFVRVVVYVAVTDGVAVDVFVGVKVSVTVGIKGAAGILLGKRVEVRTDTAVGAGIAVGAVEQEARVKRAMSRKLWGLILRNSTAHREWQSMRALVCNIGHMVGLERLVHTN